MDIQSNSIRGEMLKDVANKVVSEIEEDIIPMFGPGASDAYITKDGQPYYTRDGMEVMQSLLFDNELANYIHHIFFQAAYHQGKMVGDGSTSVIVLYTTLYKYFASTTDEYPPISELRTIWKRFTEQILEKIEIQYNTELTDENLLQLLYTCTQDPELSAKIYTELKEPIMAGAYIMPRKSNIATDFKVTPHIRPTFKVTKQFSFKPVADKIENACLLYCNGMLDIAHDEILASMTSRQMVVLGDPDTSRHYIPVNYVIICHGITEATRRSIQRFIRTIKENNWDIEHLNNLIIYTLDDYRAMTSDEIEDISTIITEEKGIGGMVQSLTFESYLYRAYVDCNALGIPPIDELETFDADSHIIERFKQAVLRQWTVIIDETEGIALEGELGPNAEERYQELLEAIKDERSAVKKEDLNQRLRRTFGQFIDVEVGSTLLKDGQRKFELVLDALLSASEAAKCGVLPVNSLLAAVDAVHDFMDTNMWDLYGKPLYMALTKCLACIIYNVHPHWKSSIEEVQDELIDRIETPGPDYNRMNFNIHNTSDPCGWPKQFELKPIKPIEVWINNTPIQFEPRIVEPVGVIRAIIENSVLPIELAMTKVFHISGRSGFMNNYIN